MAVQPIELEANQHGRALVEAHSRGDADAFAELVRDHYRVLLMQAQRRLGSRAEAEDAVQEAFERAFRGFARVGGEYRLGAWLSRIVSNVCHDHAVRRAVQRRIPEELGHRTLPEPDASEYASDPAVLKVVQAAIDALPRSQRQSFLLHEIAGLSYAQVAARLGISEANARARVHRAKAALRSHLDRTLTALGAIIAVPFGGRSLLRRLGRNAAPGTAPAGGPDLASGNASTSFPGLSAGMTQSVAQVTTGPVGQVAATLVSNSRNTLAGAAAGLATVLAVFAPGGPALPAVAAAAAIVSPAPEVAAPENIVAAVASPKPDLVAPSVPTSSDSGWVADGVAAPAGPDGAVGAPVSSCSWLPNPGDLAVAPPSWAVVSMLRTPEVSLSSVSSNPSLSSSATLEGPGTSTSVALDAHACFPPLDGALVVDLQGLGAQLRGRLVLTTGDDSLTTYLFRGAVASSTGDPLAAGLAEHFVALLRVHPATNTASLSIAFVGPPGEGSSMAPSNHIGDPTPAASPGDTGQSGSGSTTACPGTGATPTPTVGSPNGSDPSGGGSASEPSAGPPPPDPSSCTGANAGPGPGPPI